MNALSRLLTRAAKLAEEHTPSEIVAEAEQGRIPMLGVNLWRLGFAAGYCLASKEVNDPAATSPTELQARRAQIRRGS